MTISGYLNDLYTADQLPQAINIQLLRLLKEYQSLIVLCDTLADYPKILQAIEVGGLTDNLKQLVGYEQLELLGFTSTEAAKESVNKFTKTVTRVMERLFSNIIGHVKYDTFLHKRLEEGMQAHRDLDKIVVDKEYSESSIVGLTIHENAKALSEFATLFKTMDEFKSTPVTAEDTQAIYDKLKVVVQQLNNPNVKYSEVACVLAYNDVVFNGDKHTPSEIGATNPIQYCKKLLQDTEVVHRLWSPCYDHMQGYQKFIKALKTDLTHEQAKYISKSLRCLASYIVLMALYKGNRYKSGFRVLNTAKKYT
jgi:hypothetical protein